VRGSGPISPMKAKSAALVAANRQDAPARAKTARRRPTTRLPAAERRALILEKAFEIPALRPPQFLVDADMVYQA